MSIFATAFSLFLVINVLGNIPLYLSLLVKYPPARQRQILFREMSIALFVLIMFGFFGDAILSMIGITRGAIGVAGGILLLIISLTMIFPKHSEEGEAPLHEPVIVPLAIPVIAGPGSIAAVMIFAHDFSPGLLAIAILLAWIPSLLIALSSSYIRYLLGAKGLIAFERFGGLLVALIGVQMLSNGVINEVRDNFDIAPKKVERQGAKQAKVSAIKEKKSQ